MQILWILFSLAFLAQHVSANNGGDQDTSVEAPPEPFTCQGTTFHTLSQLADKTEEMKARWVTHGQTCTRRRALRAGGQPSWVRRMFWCTSSDLSILGCPERAILPGAELTVTMLYEEFFMPEFVAREGGPVLNDNEKKKMAEVQCSLTYESMCLYDVTDKPLRFSH